MVKVSSGVTFGFLWFLFVDRCCCFVSIQVGANTNVQKPKEPVASVSISRPSATANQQLKPAPDRRLRSASVKPTPSSTRQQVLLLLSHTHRPI